MIPVVRALSTKPITLHNYMGVPITLHNYREVVTLPFHSPREKERILREACDLNP
jgi:hypothetical protein